MSDAQCDRALDQKRIGQLEVIKIIVSEQIGREDRAAPLYEQVRENLRQVVAQIEHAIEAYHSE